MLTNIDAQEDEGDFLDGVEEDLAITKKPTHPNFRFPEAFRALKAKSYKMYALFKEAENLAASNAPILLFGENGTEKELLARAIHRASPRANYPFTHINIASMTNGQFAYRFFGHVNGAFANTENGQKGFLEYTNKGTLFIDEIRALPIDLQGKLLRVLREGDFTKLGAHHHQTVDIRFIAATNADLCSLTKRGKFRKDLYDMLRDSCLHLPPLRERREDIPVLVNSILKEWGEDSCRYRIRKEAMSKLIAYDYPGNSMELRSILHTAVNLAQGNVITLRTLPPDVQRLKF